MSRDGLRVRLSASRRGGRKCSTGVFGSVGLKEKRLFHAAGKAPSMGSFRRIPELKIQ